MFQILLVGLGGFGGAIARYFVDRRVAPLLGFAQPWGTLLVNVSRCFVAGLLFVLIAERELLPASLRLPLMVGFLGAYTTFSTLALQSWLLVEGGAAPLAVLHLAGSIFLGILAVIGGMALARAI